MIPRAAFFETAEGGIRPYIINGPDRRLRNPHLIIANAPERKRYTMPKLKIARNRMGQFKKGHARSNPKHHKKRNYVIAGGAVPMPNRRHARKHNPSIPIPGVGTIELDFAEILGVTAGIAGPPLLQGFVTPLMPTTAASYPTVFSLGSNVAVLIGGYMLGGRSAARDVLVGELAAFLVKQLQSIAATGAASLSSPASQYYAAGRMAGYTQPVTRGRLSGYTPPVARGAFGLGRRGHAGGGRGMLRGINGGLAQINTRNFGTRLRSRFAGA